MPANHKEKVYDEFLHIKLTKELKESLYRECAREEKVVSVVVRNLVTAYVNRQKKSRQTSKRRR